MLSCLRVGGGIMDKLLIAPIGEGLRSDLVPFMTPEDSFQTLENVYIYNGKVRRKPTIIRQGQATSILESRLRILIGVILPDGTLLGQVPGSTHKKGQQFSIGTVVYTAYQDNGFTYVSQADGSSCDYDTNNGDYQFAGCTPGASVYFYPCLKVMHIYTPKSQSSSIYFDENYSYILGTTGFEVLPLAALPVPAAATWDSSPLHIYSSVLFNNGAVEILVVASSLYDTGQLKYYNYDTNTWTNFTPKFLSAGGANANIVTKARLIKKFATRLVLFNISESDGAVTRNYPNRIRFSAEDSAYAIDSWYQYPDTIERGGYIDLPSGEIITAVEILNGRLIVFCETSVYQVVFSGNRFEPFAVTEIDSNIGSKASSVVEIGGKIVFINPFGLYYCDGVRTALLSNKINSFFTPGDFWYDFTSLFLDTENSLLFITIREANEFSPNGAYDGYIDTVLLYNFINDTYSIFYDNYTAFGLSNVDRDGEDRTAPVVMVGNNLGYMSELSFSNNQSDITMHVTALDKPDLDHIDLTIYNQSLAENIDYAIRITGSALAGLNGSYLAEYVDQSTIRIENNNAIAGYVGDAYVSIVDNIDILTKDFAPYLKKGMGVCINKLAFNVNKTAVYSIFTVNSAVSESVFDSSLEKYIETAQITTIEGLQDRVWRSVYFHSSGETISLKMGFNNEILLNPTIPFQEFSINAIILYASPTKLM